MVGKKVHRMQLRIFRYASTKFFFFLNNGFYLIRPAENIIPYNSGMAYTYCSNGMPPTVQYNIVPIDNRTRAGERTTMRKKPGKIVINLNTAAISFPD